MPPILEIFGDPTCPYSKKAFLKVLPLAKLCPGLRISVILNTQPWHLMSNVVVRCIVAALALLLAPVATVVVVVFGARHLAGGALLRAALVAVVAPASQPTRLLAAVRREACLRTPLAPMPIVLGACLGTVGAVHSSIGGY